MAWKSTEFFYTHLSIFDCSKYSMFQFKSDDYICIRTNGFDFNSFKEFEKIKWE